MGRGTVVKQARPLRSTCPPGVRRGISPVLLKKEQGIMRTGRLLGVLLILALTICGLAGCAKQSPEQAVANAPMGGAAPQAIPAAGQPGTMGGQGAPGMGPMPAGATSAPPAMPEPGPMGAPSAAPTRPASVGAGLDAPTLIHEGMAAKRAGNRRQAIDYLEKSLGADPNSEPASWALAWLYAQTGRRAEAIQQFNRVLQLTSDPKHRAEAQKALDRIK